MSDPYTANRACISSRLLFFGFLAGGVAYIGVQVDHVSAAFLGFVSLAALVGYLLGGARFVGIAVALMAALAFAPLSGELIEPYAGRWTGTEGTVSRIVSIGLAGLGIVLFVKLSVRGIARWVLRKRPELDVWNRWVGCLVGAAQGTMAAWLFACGLLVVEPFAEDSLHAHSPGRNSSVQRAIARRVIDAADRTKRSVLGSHLVRHNPLERLSGSGHLEQLIGDPNSVETLVSGDALKNGSAFSQIEKLLTQMGASGGELPGTGSSRPRYLENPHFRERQ